MRTCPPLSARRRQVRIELLVLRLRRSNSAVRLCLTERDLLDQGGEAKPRRNFLKNKTRRKAVGFPHWAAAKPQKFAS